MLLSIGRVQNVKVRQEDIQLIEKVLEGCLLYLCVYKEIKVMLVGGQGNSAIFVKGVSLSMQNRVEINSCNEELMFDNECELKGAYENSSVCITTRESNGIKYNDIIVPINNDTFEVIGFLIFSAENGKEACKEKLLEGLRDKTFISNLEKLYSRFIPDALLFYDVSGKFHEVNLIASEINNNLLDDESGNIFEYINSNGTGKINLKRIKEQTNCFAGYFTVKSSELAVILIPFYNEPVFEGFLVVISDMTLIRKKDKELMGKSAVIKEIHHRVKNNLQTIASLLRLQMRRSNSSVLEKAFFASINRISSIALIHEALSKEGLDRVSLKLTIKSILEMILTTMVDPQKAIKGEIRGVDIYLNSSQASNLSLCITELVQNAIEHAFVYRAKGNIIITIGHDGTEAVILVEDDGVGMTVKKTKGKSLGLQIIELITTENLTGTFTMEGHTYGSRAEIRFPIQK